MNEQDLKYIIEATLLAAGRPVPTQQLVDLFDERERPTLEQARAALDLLAADYELRGIELVEVASGWRIQVRARCVDVVSRLWQERASRYSRALLETLALIAYRQPITRSEIEEIRGVSISSTIMRTLQERNWIRVVGHREVPGHPELLGTTREFLDYFGLKSLDQLPTLAELRDLENIGVQLELPSGEMTAEVAAAGESEVDASATGDDVAGDGAPIEKPASDGTGTDDTPGEEGELSADAAQLDDLGDESGDESDDDEESTPTLVASSETDSQDERRNISEPPGEDR
jgi:segregation and condensation protein B